MNIKKRKSFSVKERLRSFKYAFNGLKTLIEEEHNARIHIATTIFTIALGVAFNISATEWLAVTILIGLVICTETINSAIENICDFVSPGKHCSIRKIKDLSAAAVLLASITAVIGGIIIFLPKLCDFFANIAD
ncbi:diacylglycerol kinase family protein [Dysgonomonas sp. 511]|uniref:diacylglycerol kinase family protein n=1 Tax=Dysgonomonas sp. 511 TaxID=2302930 RepID=UPI0013D43714|nr:diacylglycerol kinase family protein [Dysgonomonas sp. 511]NDV78546.1 diacylglycerol kinase family protein [Dysgonomonas sp. 511]